MLHSAHVRRRWDPGRVTRPSVTASSLSRLEAGLVNLVRTPILEAAMSSSLAVQDIHWADHWFARLGPPRSGRHSHCSDS